MYETLCSCNCVFGIGLVIGIDKHKQLQPYERYDCKRYEPGVGKNAFRKAGSVDNARHHYEL